MSINWYPGHMAKTSRLIKAKRKFIDVVIELLDARCPQASHNPMLEELLAEKPRLILLNKADLADPETTKLWIKHFNSKGYVALANEIVSGRSHRQILPVIKDIYQKAVKQGQVRKKISKAINIIIVGIPNVGKSALLNSLIGKKRAEVGDRPAVTKRDNWVYLGEGINLLDTPGILWPKFEDQLIGYRLALINAIKQQILDLEDITVWACDFMQKHYAEALKQRFKLESLPEDPVHTLELIGKKRACYLNAKELDYDRLYELFLKELRSGKMGRISFESVL